MKKSKRMKANKNKLQAEPVVSVIVPIYNAEKYLKQMMNSVLCQTLNQIEIICVDDGSTDSSREIIREFMGRDERIILMQQPKMNAGAARNTGLSKAKGKYVIFWDADDLFERKALECLYRKIEKKNADICLCGVCELRENGKVYETEGYLKTDLLPEKDPFNKFDNSKYLFDFTTNVVWNKMYRRTFLEKNELRFQEIERTNDTAFVMMSLYKAQAITYVNKNLIFYRVNLPDSLTGRASELIFCPYESYIFTLQEFQKCKDFALVKNSFYNKAVKGMLRSLDTQTSFPAYAKLYDFLQLQGFRNLGLDSCEDLEFYEDWVLNDLRKLKSVPAEEFLLYKANERRWDRDQLKYTLRRVRRRLAPLLKLNQKLKSIR